MKKKLILLINFQARDPTECKPDPFNWLANSHGEPQAQANAAQRLGQRRRHQKDAPRTRPIHVQRRRSRPQTLASPKRATKINLARPGPPDQLVQLGHRQPIDSGVEKSSNYALKSKTNPNDFYG